MADLSKLNPTHLIPDGTTSADLKAAVVEKMEEAASSASPEDERKKLMGQRSYTFPFSFTDANGKEFTGTFTNKVPGIRNRLDIGVMRAQLSGGLDFDSLDPLTKDIAMMVAHLTYTLEDKGRPEWAKDLLKVDNPAVLRALWGEVTLHEATFLGL